MDKARKAVSVAGAFLMIVLILEWLFTRAYDTPLVDWLDRSIGHLARFPMDYLETALFLAIWAAITLGPLSLLAEWWQSRRH